MTARKIITHCAPTLAGLKTANLFNEHFESKDHLLEEIKWFNIVFKDYGLKMVPLTLENNRALIYVYRKYELEHDFSNNVSKELLEKYGYDSTNINKSIKILSGKMSHYDTFPHEVGLFLGYPPTDVKAFIENGGKNCKFTGYWKAYSNVSEAIKIFKKYHRCQEIYLNRLNKGFTLKQLVIKTGGV